MADDRNNHRGGFVRQPHGAGHSSPPPPAPSSGPGPGDPASPRSVQKENSPPRGPRTLLLRRSENGYGFTLRHFIVYPPESCCMLPGHERTKVDEPMDTIFVKQVRANSPAAEAGLRTGDRVVSVDGTPTRGEQYASVVQRIQQAGPWLRLLVVSKEDDILQRYFGDTAHNPETNQRPRLRSPERLSQKQRKSMSSMIPGGSPRTRQSWVCSLPSSESPNHQEEAMCGMSPSTMSQFPIMESQIANALQQQKQQQRRGISEASALYDLSEDSRVPGRKLQLLREDNVQPSGRLSLDSKYDLYDRTRPESVYSRPSNEQLYDRINDPIYERVRVSEHHLQHYYQPSLLRYPVSQAEPQVPIYRPIKRMVARRASEGSGNVDSEMASYGSIDALRSRESSRLSMESRRDSSPVASKDSMSPYDSNSTLTGNECSDDSVIMNRLRKSFEQKAEFLRRPSYPVGWSVESSLLPNIDQSAVIQREFYARPQKLQRQIWPPGQNEQQRQQSPTRRSQERNVVTKTVTSLNKPSNQSVQMIKDVDSNSEYSKPRNDQQLGDNQSVAGDHCYSPSLLYDNELAKEQQYRGTGKGSFVSILSRIHENISTNQQQTSQETRNGSSSLPSSPGPDKKAGNDRFPVPPQGLQIVSRRAKQFESGRLLSDEDEPAGDRTNLYKSELSRLSNKRSVPNVAVRKREFESKAENQDSRRLPARETKSLDTGAALTGNRIIPIGSKHIHCEPPADYKESKDMPTMETESVRLRARSNSAESWEATNGPAARSNARHTWQTAEEEGSTEDNNKVYRNQDNYLQSAKLQIAPVNGSSPNGSTNNAAVLRRQKNAQISDEDRATRRVSYLKATWGERMHVDSDLELSDSEPVHIHRNAHRRWRPPLFPSDITPLRRIFEDMTQVASLHRNSHHRNSIAVTSNSCDETAKDAEPVEREGTLHVKFTVLDGKRSTDRSWKQVWGVLRGPIIYFYKDRHSQSLQSPSLSTESETNAGQSVDVRCSVVDVAEDYTKRKHVLRVANPTAEVLLQTEDAASMALWLRSLHSHAAAEKSSDAISCTSKQQAVPQTPTGPTTPNSGVPPSNVQRLSPLPSHKGIKKLTSFRNRSPTGQSPVNKTRKPSNQMVEPLPSPKSKTWKGRMAKQFRRMHGQAGGAPSSPTAQSPPEGATFKVPLEICPASSFSEYVPLIVEMCTSIVEARGLEVVGIYRVPGNTAAIGQLTDNVNRGFENINFQDPRWSDVNVISSLLKSFFRQLPDSLLTADLYPMFIDADKIEDPQRRMTTIRKLLRDLPEHHFETLKYLMQHLKKIVEHSEINKMEAKNLAIVFGPTLVRASGSRDNMVTMVTDMSHQCRIVESLLNNVDWFFSEDDLDDLSRLSVNLSLPTDSCEVESASNHSLLLNNIQKIEGMRDMASAKDIVSSIISAANKKIQRRRKNQDEIDNSEHDNDKVKSKQESENLQTIRRQSMALNERQCSVSEIVQMHESKSQPNHSTDRSLSVDSNNSGSSHGTCSSSRTKYAFQSAPPSVDSTRLSIDTGLNSAETGSTVSSNASNQTKQSNDEIAILTYAGLSATTQERVRRFEEETKAMLQRDQHRQRLEAEKREEERRRIEIEWQLAKREMENDDLLDSIVDTTVSPSLLSERLSSLNERLADKSLIDLSERHGRSRSTTRPPLSIAVQQQPMMHQKAQATNQLTSILGEKMNNGVIKKFKTDKDPSMESICLPPVRYGSLDSLHEVHNLSQSSPSPSQQQRGVPGDGSDDGSDLLTSLTTTFDRKWRSLINQSSNQAQPPPESASCNKNDITEQQEQKQKPSASPRTKYPSTEAYRDPSLHKSLDKSHLARPKDDAPEKDTDSTVADNMPHSSEFITPNNDRGANDKQKLETKPMTNNATENEGQKDVDEGDDCLRAGNPKRHELSSEKELQESKSENNDVSAKVEDNSRSHHYYETGDSSYSNKLKKFESLTNSQARSRLKRSESLNKRTCENTTSRLKRSESLNKHSTERLSPLKRSESLNKHSGDRSESPGSKLKRSESLTKTEKTECNISKRRQSVRKESATKLKRKNGMSERSIKRRHTVGSTKDFDKVHWLDNKLQSEAERVIRSDYRPKKSQLRTSSPDLSTNRVGMADTSFLIEVSFRGPSNVVFNVTNAARPQSLPDASLASKVFKVPLESHV
ncbi:rho GTPase activating protein at 19D isoform X3 [Temnothorax americanus]|uniref:rho GTPase activating protein at 19D isoform X3 n=1 Tax=Temnothorax americanus TaxID=1964332 RepID=UPI00406835DF